MVVAYLFLNIVGIAQYALALTVVVGLFASRASDRDDHLDGDRFDRRFRSHPPLA